MAQGIDRLAEASDLIDLYDHSGLALEQFGNEAYKAIRMIVKQGIPAREQRLSIQVPLAARGSVQE